MTPKEQLLNLVAQNPALPIVPMVEGEVCGDEYGRYVGEFGDCRIGEYALMDDMVYFDKEHFVEDLFSANDDMLCEAFGYRFAEPTEGDEAAERRLDNFLYAIADKVFQPAIIVNIDCAGGILPASATELVDYALKERGV